MITNLYSKNKLALFKKYSLSELKLLDRLCFINGNDMNTKYDRPNFYTCIVHNFAKNKIDRE
jgi:hypothetical protein